MRVPLLIVLVNLGVSLQRAGLRKGRALHYKSVRAHTNALRAFRCDPSREEGESTKAMVYGLLFYTFPLSTQSEYPLDMIGAPADNGATYALYF